MCHSLTLEKHHSYFVLNANCELNVCPAFTEAFVPCFLLCLDLNFLQISVLLTPRKLIFLFSAH